MGWGLWSGLVPPQENKINFIGKVCCSSCDELIRVSIVKVRTYESTFLDACYHCGLKFRIDIYIYIYIYIVRVVVMCSTGYMAV